MRCIPAKIIELLIFFWKENNYCNKIELAALEPLLYRDSGKDIGDICSLIQDANLKCSITTNGFCLHKFVNKLTGKVDKVRVSLHSMDRDIYRQIMGYDGYEQVIRNIKSAVQSGINISINRVLLKNYTKDLEEQIEFVNHLKINLKLLDLYYTDDIGNHYEQFYIAPEQVLESFVASGVLKFCEEKSFNRNRRVYSTRDGGTVEYKLQADCTNKNDPICLHCSKKNFCLEGYADYLRVFPDGKGTFCYMRRETDFDIFNEKNKLILEKDNRFYRVPLRLVITDTCNFNCGFPKATKSWCLKRFRDFNYLVERV